MVEYNRFSVGNFTIQEQVTTGNFVIYLIELCLCVIGIVTNFMFVVVLWRAELLHQNLRVVLFSICLSNFLFGFSRFPITIPLIIAHLFNVEISSITFCWAAKSVHHVLMGVPATSFFCVIMERAIASFFYQTYEKHQSCHFCGYFLAAFQWSFALFMTVINQIDVASKPNPYARLPCQIEYSSSRGVFISIILAYTLNVIAGFTLWKMIKFNRKLYKQRVWKLKTLSETFQVSENVKSSKIISPLLLIMFCSNFIFMIIVALQAVVYVLVREAPVNQQDELTIQLSIKIIGRGSEVSQSVDIVSAVTKIIFCFIMRSHPILHRKWSQIFGAKKVEPRLETARKLTILEETDHHFDSLKLLWEK